MRPLALLIERVKAVARYQAWPTAGLLGALCWLQGPAQLCLKNILFATKWKQKELFVLTSNLHSRSVNGIQSIWYFSCWNILMFSSKNIMNKHPKKTLSALHFSRPSCSQSSRTHASLMEREFDTLVPRIYNVYLYQKQLWGHCNLLTSLGICRDQGYLRILGINYQRKTSLNKIHFILN